MQYVGYVVYIIYDKSRVRGGGAVGQGGLNLFFLTGLPGSLCMKVVERLIGGTTAFEAHLSGCWPAWMAAVAKWGKG